MCSSADKWVLATALLSAHGDRLCEPLSDLLRGLRQHTSEVRFTAFERVFKEFGLPQAIRTDNGSPFASGGSFFGLTKLSVWWLRLGIAIERIKPGNPQQNGRHERMHRTLKKEATRPAAKNLLQQQGKFDAFMLQQPATASSTEHEVSDGALQALASALQRPTQGSVSLP
jgi:transposase InsO family protein